ncbi:hypothetical protein FKP32DRAFT_1609244 [Trametes sanguinea]|nr:hypothetical protein FKP32DRAFT_1609244 [Trametes sanguinea]
MVYVRSRKFCCCLPVRFGVFCESLLGIAIGGLFAVGGWITVHQILKGTVSPPYSSGEKTAVWFLSIISTLILLISFMGLIGSIFKILPLVGLYAGSIAAATVADIAIGIYVIYQLFHGEAASDVNKCVANAGDGVNKDFAHFACSGSFKVGRVIVIVLYVIFWIITIYGCHIAFQYVGQLQEERDQPEGRSDFEKSSQVQNVNVVAAPAGQYPFSAAPNAMGGRF